MGKCFAAKSVPDSFQASKVFAQMSAERSTHVMAELI